MLKTIHINRMVSRLDAAATLVHDGYTFKLFIISNMVHREACRAGGPHDDAACGSVALSHRGLRCASHGPDELFVPSVHVGALAAALRDQRDSGVRTGEGSVQPPSRHAAPGRV